MKAPKAKDVQVRVTPSGRHSVTCRHGKEITAHGEAHALFLWAVSHKGVKP